MKKNIVPACYHEWKKLIEGKEKTGVIEYPLFTDASRFIDDISFGPYQIITLETPNHELVLTRFVLRVSLYETTINQPQITTETPIDFYLVNNAHIQIASLLSLCLGVRIKAGNISRFFSNQDGNDPLGTPCAYNIHANPPSIRMTGDSVVLPSALRNMYRDDSIFQLSEIAHYLSLFIQLTEKQAELLIRAAKLYGDALWLMETEPQLAWIMLVSAIEVVAANHIISKSTPDEVFKEAYPDLVSDILSHDNGVKLLPQIADIFVEKKHISKKYKKFMLDFLPDPPPRRGMPNMQIEWSDLRREDNSNPLMKIYDYRSKALHAGQLFPDDMCYRLSGTGIPYDFAEKSQSIHAIVNGTHQKNKPGPMLISIYEYIVRNALLKWWLNCVEKK